ncbi:MAG TPA: SCO family protein [Pseudomonadales bacterium]
MFAALVAPLVTTGAEHQHEPPVVLAPGYADLEFVAPAPGTYQLPTLRNAADGAVIDEAGAAHRLHDYLGDRVVVLSFIYTTCSDVNGCPLAAYVLKRVQERALADPSLHDRLRLVSLSFDPEHDTPDVMAAYAARLRADESDWVFLTSSSDAALAPLLDAYDQFVIRDESGAISHTLRVVLIDRELRVRNIYSVSFLHADTVLNDVRTLLLEVDRAASKSASPAGPSAAG